MVLAGTGVFVSQVTVADSTDDLDDLQATLWHDDPTFASSAAADIGAEVVGSADFGQAALPPALESTSTSSVTSLPASTQLQQLTSGHHGTTQNSVSGTTNIVGVDSSFQSVAPTSHVESSQVVPQTNFALVAGTRYEFVFWCVIHKPPCKQFKLRILYRALERLFLKQLIQAYCELKSDTNQAYCIQPTGNKIELTNSTLLI